MDIYMVRGLGKAPGEAPESVPGASQGVREMEIYMVRCMGEAPGRPRRGSQGRHRGSGRWKST